MAITLISAEYRGTRRVRCTFSQALAAGAFTAVTFYAVTNQDGKGVSPNVVAALQIVSQTNAVELALDADLVNGALYAFVGTAVPAADASTFTGSQPFAVGTPIGRAVNAELLAQDAETLVYGTDCVWTGADYLETPQGDLAALAGLQNVEQALPRRVRALGLPWNPAYGARLDEVVGSPPTSQVTARGTLTAQMLRDDRVEAVKIDVIFDEDVPDTVLFNIKPQLVGGRKIAPFKMGANP